MRVAAGFWWLNLRGCSNLVAVEAGWLWWSPSDPTEDDISRGVGFDRGWPLDFSVRAFSRVAIHVRRNLRSDDEFLLL